MLGIISNEPKSNYILLFGTLITYCLNFLSIIFFSVLYFTFCFVLVKMEILMRYVSNKDVDLSYSKEFDHDKVPAKGDYILYDAVFTCVLLPKICQLIIRIPPSLHYRILFLVLWKVSEHNFHLLILKHAFKCIFARQYFMLIEF